MAAASTIALVASAVVSAGAAYSSHRQGQKAADAEKESQRISSNQARSQQQNERRQAMRQERIRRAQILASSEASGVSGSSSETGALGGMATTVGSNMASLDQAGRTTTALAGLGSQAAAARSRAASSQAVGNLSGTVFSSLGGGEALANFLAPNPTTRNPGQ